MQAQCLIDALKPVSTPSHITPVSPSSAPNPTRLSTSQSGGCGVTSAGLFAAKISFEKRDCPLMDLVNERRDWVGTHLFEVMSSVLDRYEFNFESEAFIRLRHLNRLFERNKVVLFSMHEQKRRIIFRNVLYWARLFV